MSGCVYFVLGGDKADRVKVGYTATLQARMRQLGTASSAPLRLVGIVPGDRALEQRCHEQLARHRIYGEWFKRRPALALLAVLSDRDSPIRINEALKTSFEPNEALQKARQDAAKYRRRLREVEAELARVREVLAATRAQLDHEQLTIFGV